MMTRAQGIAFLLFAAIYCLATLLEPFAFSWVLKVIPLFILILSSVKLIRASYEKIFIAGLVFSTLGDYLLGYNGNAWFVFGLGAFLIAHLFYMVSFKPIQMPMTLQKWLFILLYSIYGLAMMTLITPGLGELFVLVLIYMTVLLFMAMATLLSDKSNKWLMIGVLSFVMSDSLIGINKFYQTIVYADFMIMTSYNFAQYALVRGLFDTAKAKRQINSSRLLTLSADN